MKTILKMTLACVLSLSLMTLMSCGSKVNQKELNEKIEKASENEGLGDASFTDAEYDFMAKYLLDRVSKNKEVQPDDPEAETIGNYMMILAMAQSQNKLKGDAKKDFEDIREKIDSMDGQSASSTNQSFRPRAELTNEELIAEYAQLANEIINEYKSTGSYDNKKMERMVELQICAYSEKDMSSEEIAQIDSITKEYTEAMAE